MAIIKFINLNATTAGSKDFLIEDTPEGLKLSRNHIRPVSPRRTQNGTLITQTIYYNKKGFTLEGGEYHNALITYLKSLYESGENATLTVYDIDGNFAVVTEYTATVKMTKLEDGKDFVDNTRSWTAEFEEV